MQRCKCAWQQIRMKTDKQSGNCESSRLRYEATLWPLCERVRVFWWRLCCCHAACIKYLCAAKYAIHKKMFATRRVQLFALKWNYEQQQKKKKKQNERKQAAKKRQKLYARQSLLLKCCAFNFYFSPFSRSRSLSTSFFIMGLRTLSSILLHARLQRTARSVGGKLFINNDFPLTIDWFRSCSIRGNCGNNKAKVANRNALQTMRAATTTTTMALTTTTTLESILNVNNNNTRGTACGRVLQAHNRRRRQEKLIENFFFYTWRVRVQVPLQLTLSLLLSGSLLPTASPSFALLLWAALRAALCHSVSTI